MSDFICIWKIRFRNGEAENSNTNLFSIVLRSGHRRDSRRMIKDKALKIKMKYLNVLLSSTFYCQAKFYKEKFNLCLLELPFRSLSFAVLTYRFVKPRKSPALLFGWWSGDEFDWIISHGRYFETLHTTDNGFWRPRPSVTSVTSALTIKGGAPTMRIIQIIRLNNVYKFTVYHDQIITSVWTS